MLRPYEVMVIFDAGLEEGAIRAVLDRAVETIRAKGGNPGRVDLWGKRRFAYRDLTPTEIRVANLIREGRSSKEVAERLGLSPRTVHTHRYNIRKKLNLCGGSKTLRAHLCAME